MGFDVAAHNASQGAYEIVNLTGSSATNGVGNTNTVDADLVDSLVKCEKVDKIGSERIFGRKADLSSSTVKG